MNLAFLSIGSKITDSIQDFFYQIIWEIIRAILMIIDEIQTAFYILAGVKSIPVAMDGAETEISLLEYLFGITRVSNGNEFVYHFDFGLNNRMMQVYFGMLMLFAVLFVFAIVCSAVKISMNKQDKEALPSMGKLLWKSVQAIGIVLFMPILIAILIVFMGIIMRYLDGLFNLRLLQSDNDGNILSIGQAIFKSNCDSYVPSEQQMDWTKINWSNFSYVQFKDFVGDISHFNFFLAVLTSCCCLVGLAMGSIMITERIINIALLFLISPIIVSTIPLDDGKRFETWKDNMTAKLTTVAGNVLSIYIFLYIIQVFGNKLLGSLDNTHRFTMQLVFLVVAVSGAFSCAKGGTLIAGLVSSNQGQQEGMSFMASSKLLSMGGSIAGKAIGAAAGVTGLKALGNSLKGNSNGGTQNGTGSGDDVGTATKDTTSPSDNFNRTLSSNARSSATSESNESKGLVGRARGAVSTASDVGNQILGKVGNTAASGVHMLTVPGLLKSGIGIAAVGVGGVAMIGGGIFNVAKKGIRNLGGDYKPGSNKKFSGLSRNEAKDRGMTSAERREYNSNARNMNRLESRLAKADSRLNKAYQTQDKLDVKAQRAENKAVYKSTDTNDKQQKRLNDRATRLKNNANQNRESRTKGAEKTYSAVERLQNNYAKKQEELLKPKTTTNSTQGSVGNNNGQINRVKEHLKKNNNNNQGGNDK